MIKDLICSKYKQKVFLCALSLALMGWLTHGCGYKDISTDNGRLAVIQQANSFLTSGMCDQALEVLQPLYTSSSVDNEVRMVYSSAYACKAGFDFPEVIGRLRGSGTIWALLVMAMYSNGSDNHLTYYQNAAVPLRMTSSVAGSFVAADRPDDANVYMIFMQAGALASVLSVLGNANATTGAKGNAITGTGTNAQKCAVQVAIATIVDSLNVVGTSGALQSLATSLAPLCSGSICNNKDPAVCDAANILNGTALIAAIDTQWI